MKADDAKRLKELESQNAQLKKIVAEQALDIDMLKYVAEKKWVTVRERLAVVESQWMTCKTSSGFLNAERAG